MKRDDFIVGEDEDIEVQSTALEPKTRLRPGEKIALVKLDGTGISTEGNLVKHNWFKGLELNHAKYADIVLTAEEAQRLHSAKNRMKLGAHASSIMLCYGAEICPMASKCQPPGTLVLTSQHGEIPIEELDENIHQLVSYRRQSSLILGTQRGYRFKKYSTIFEGELRELSTESGYSHRCTPEHISIVKWSPKALDKYCVYLMQKGDDFHVGKTKLLRHENQGLRFGPSSRALSEKADRLWVLGVYETNVEALLAEEYFSCEFGVGKALFFATPNTKQRQDGLYAWVTQEQLNRHHQSLRKTADEISRLLGSIGLLYDYPIWSRDELWDPYCDQRLGTTKLLEIRTANIISGYMEVQIFDKGQKWETVTMGRVPYSGLVWSLDVEKYGTYIANKIVTHNCPLVEMQREIDASGERRNIVPIGRDCPIEAELFFEWVARYAEEFGVTDEAGNYTDQRLLLELAECEVLEHRMNVVLSTKYQDLSEDKVVAVMQDEYGEREQHVKDIADAAKIKEKLGIRKDKIYKALVATRHDQYKREAALNDSVRTDNANLQSEMLARIKKFENLLAKE